MNDANTWLTSFRPFSPSHALALAWTLPLIVASCWLGRRFLQASRVSSERQLCAVWAGAVIIINLWSLVFWFLPENFDLRKSLPLQLCDIAALTVPLVFLSGMRWPRTLIYFLGIGLSTQAFVTPTVQHGLGTQQYWLFWLLHTAIVGSAVYDLVVRRYRPTLRDLAIALVVTTSWFLAMFGLNIWLGAGANYAYVGNTTPLNPTIIDRLGPWPRRVGVLAAIGTVLFILLWAIWPLARRLRGTRQTTIIP